MNTDYEKDFISIQKELTSFIYRLTCSKQEAEDIVQDTFIAVVNNIQTFRQESSFRTWVYSIAINKAKNSLRVQRKWNVDFQDKGEALHLENKDLLDKLVDTYQSQPDIDFEIKEHITYCFNCITKTLDLPQQICIWLKEFYSFTAKEIEETTGMTEGEVKHALSYGRKHMTEVFDNRCAFINKKGTCHQCTALKGVLNPKQDALAEANKLKLSRQVSSNETLLEIRMHLIKDINPLKSSNSHLHTYMLEKLPEWADKKSEK